MSAARGRTKVENAPKSTLAGRTAAKRARVVTDTTPMLAKPVRRRFHNVPTEFDGYRFDSKAEAARYIELRALERDGDIRQLEIHPKFPLVIHEQDCGVYIADFCYLTAAGERVIEDVKSPATRKLAVYRLKKRQVWALYGIEIREVVA